MLENSKISAFQMGLMMYCTVLGTGFLTVPVATAYYAKNDLWIPCILASLIGFISAYLAIRLHDLYPKQTIIQYSEHIIGKIPGKVVGILYFLFLLQQTGIIIRQYAEFVAANFLFKTPMVLSISSMILLSAFAVRGGVEVLARSTQIFAPIFVFSLLILLLLFPELDVKNILPIMRQGITPIIKGTITPQAWASQIFLMSFFLPYLTDPENSRKSGWVSMVAIISSFIYFDLIVLFLFGSDTSNKLYPILTAFRYINIGNFFQNVEALLLGMWVVGNFIKIGVFYFATVHSLVQCLKLSDYRFVVFPMALLILIFSYWDLPSLSKMNSLLKTVAPFEISAFCWLIPLLLLIMAVLQKKKGESEHGR